MKDWLLQIFTWWNGQTIGTRFHTWRFGERVGEDEFGNVYYRTKGGVKDGALGYQRRWVIYNGEAEASKVPPGWKGWLQHTVDVAPS
ncbi:NADH-ubiquinone oxidoreductase subunit NDUFA12 family protein, partial [Bosea sp. (in: a-proteobacteria)]